LSLRSIGLQLWVAVPIDLSHLLKKKGIGNKGKVLYKKKTKSEREREREE